MSIPIIWICRDEAEVWFVTTLDNRPMGFVSRTSMGTWRIGVYDVDNEDFSSYAKFEDLDENKAKAELERILVGKGYRFLTQAEQNLL